MADGGQQANMMPRRHDFHQREADLRFDLMFHNFLICLFGVHRRFARCELHPGQFDDYIHVHEWP